MSSRPKPWVLKRVSRDVFRVGISEAFKDLTKTEGLTAFKSFSGLIGSPIVPCGVDLVIVPLGVAGLA